MLIKFVLPAIAAGALGFGAATTMILTPSEQLSSPANTPAVTTLGPGSVAGLGSVEPAGETIGLGVPIAGLVQHVYVTTGDRVRKDQPLFSLDDRDLRAERAVRQAHLAAENAKLQRLRAGTRPEDLPPARARVRVAEVAVERAADQRQRGEKMLELNAVSIEEERIRRFAHELAAAELLTARAELAKLEAGAWEADIAVAQSEVESASAALSKVEADLQRLIITSPVDGTVLRCNVRVGEYAESAGAGSSSPLMMLAPSGNLQVRVQIDEEDASRVQAGAKAQGFVRGRSRAAIEMKFVRIEPSFVPKRNLTGETIERIDSRVLMVIYEVVGKVPTLYVGQQLDVFIEAPQPPALTQASHTHAGANGPGVMRL